ncbi:MAG: hypothetical protein ACI4DP_02255 [Candidatus Ornithomonoglobus sp.]
MKSAYKNPEINIVLFSVRNIITTSGSGDELKGKLAEKGVNVNSDAYKETTEAAVFNFVL